MAVYLIHLSKKFKHAGHYIGFCTTVRTISQRIEHHRRGQGARLLKAVSEAGIDFEVVRIWKKGDRNFERKLKNRAETWRLCPYCNPSHCANYARKVK